MNKDIFKICFTGVMLALAVVLSVFCQIRLFGDIRLDLSYMVIVVMCYAYGALVGGMFATGVALFNSAFFSSYGVSVSWMAANVIIGMITGLVLHYIKVKKTWLKIVIDLSAIIVSCAIGLLFTKTIIECNLYNIPFEVKIIKNLVAFGSDTALMIVGYFVLLPVYKRFVEKKLEQKTSN
jgi:uncharacterized membrane protein